MEGARRGAGRRTLGRKWSDRGAGRVERHRGSPPDRAASAILPPVSEPSAEVTRAIERLKAGDPAAAERVFALLYDELRRIAERVFRSQRPEHTLQATALVHEAYLKMVDAPGAQDWKDRAHVLAVAVRAMRQVLANHARDAAAQKRGGREARARVTLAGLRADGADHAVDAAAFHEALDRLAALDERQARIAEMRLLGGLPTEHVATLLGVSTRTVELDWSMAKRRLAAWLAPPAAGVGPAAAPGA